MDTFEALRRRRTIRRFQDRPLEPGLLEQILLAGTWAPTSGNLQPWEFIRIVTPEVREAVVATTYGGFSQSAPSQAWLGTSAELLVVCANVVRTAARYGPDGPAYARLDVAAAIQNMLIAATALEVGAAWIGGFRHGELSTVLNLDAELEPVGMVALGHPAEEPVEPYRLPLSDLLSER